MRHRIIAWSLYMALVLGAGAVAWWILNRVQNMGMP